MPKSKTLTASSPAANRKTRPMRRNKVKKQPDFIPYSDLAEEHENDENSTYYQDDDAYRRLSSIRPQQDWDEEDGLNVWWNWGN
ncbi:MAG: hypothetical protein ACE14V_10685 [bacterium]